MIRTSLLLSLFINLVGCATSSDQDRRPYVCKAVSPEEENAGGHGGHFFSDPNPSQSKLVALRMCREHHDICYIHYCNRDFKVPEN